MAPKVNSNRPVSANENNDDGVVHGNRHPASADGVQVDVTMIAQEAGIRFPALLRDDQRFAEY